MNANSRTTSAASPVAQTGPDLFGPVHKGLRRKLFDVAVALGSVDWTDLSARELVLARLDEALLLMSHHAEAEDSIIFPIARKYGVPAECIPDQDHVRVRHEISEMRALAGAFQTLSADQVVAHGQRVYGAFVAMVAIDLEHMRREEEVLVPRLLQLVPPQQLGGALAEIQRSFSLDVFGRFVHWMLPALTPTERAAMLQGLAATVPPEMLARAQAVRAQVAPDVAEMRLLQIDFGFKGPWGEQLAKEARALALDIAGAEGLVWKIWTENPAAARAGGIYLFATEAHLQGYLEIHRKRLAGMGVKDIRVQVFEVNTGLTRIDRGPLPVI